MKRLLRDSELSTSEEMKEPFLEDQKVILDLGQEGVLFKKDLVKTIGNVSDYARDYRWVGQRIYGEIVGEVVQMLNLPPIEAIEMCKYVPKTRSARELIVLLQLRELDVLRSLCQEGSLRLFQKLRSQLTRDIYVQYSPFIAGDDYVIIRKIDTFPPVSFPR